MLLHLRIAIQCHIRMLAIIKLLPMRGIVLKFIKWCKLELPRPVITYWPVISLNIRILLRFAWLNKRQGYILLSGLWQQYLVGIFWPVISSYCCCLHFNTISCSRVLTTRFTGSEKSTSIANTSRLKSSIPWSCHALTQRHTDLSSAPKRSVVQRAPSWPAI